MSRPWPNQQWGGLFFQRCLKSVCTGVWSASSRCLRAIVAALLLSFFFCGCLSTVVEAPWAGEARKITAGMTRTEAEAFLPAYTTRETSLGAFGKQRDYYAVGEHWRVAIDYRATLQSNIYLREAPTNGEKVLRGPLTGFTYQPDSNDCVMAGPFFEFFRSRRAANGIR